MGNHCLSTLPNRYWQFKGDFTLPVFTHRLVGSTKDPLRLMLCDGVLTQERTVPVHCTQEKRTRQVSVDSILAKLECLPESKNRFTPCYMNNCLITLGEKQSDGVGKPKTPCSVLPESTSAGIIETGEIKLHHLRLKGSAVRTTFASQRLDLL